MVLTIRLQNLSLSASPEDIRQFFSGLSIPECGIHIFGGEDGLAFIKFSTDVNAVLALAKDGGEIKGKKVKLLLSNEKEMASIIQNTQRMISGNIQPDLSLLFPSLNLQQLSKPSISNINGNPHCKRPLLRDPRLDRNMHFKRLHKGRDICDELSNFHESLLGGIPHDLQPNSALQSYNECETHSANAEQFSMLLPVSVDSTLDSAVPKSAFDQVSTRAPLLPTPHSSPVYESKPLLNPSTKITSHNQFLRFHPYNTSFRKQRREF